MTPNPFLTIWLSPRETIRRIVEWNPNYCVIWLACLVGIGQALDQSTERDVSNKLPMVAILAIAILFGPLVGLLQLWISAVVIRWTGKILGGTASGQQLRAAVAWGYAPAVFALPLFFVTWLIGGPELFTKPPAHLDTPLGRGLLYAAVHAVQIALTIWSIFAVSNTVAEVQGYHSAWRGLSNLLLPFILFVGLILVAILIPTVLIRSGGALFH